MNKNTVSTCTDAESQQAKATFSVVYSHYALVEGFLKFRLVG